MAERTEPEITREDIIVVDTIGENEYGDLNWTDKAGKGYKVKQARRKYFDEVIKPNLAVKLGFAEFTPPKAKRAIEYVYRAELVSEEVAKLQPQAPQAKIEPPKTETQQDVRKEKATPSKDRAFALSYSKDLAVAKVIMVDKILAYAEVFELFLNGDLKLENPAEFLTGIMKHFTRIEDKPKAE